MKRLFLDVEKRPLVLELAPLDARNLRNAIRGSGIDFDVFTTAKSFLDLLQDYVNE